jgi:hypothetical protein
MKTRRDVTQSNALPLGITAADVKQLERVARNYKPSRRFWTEDEDRFLKRFFGRIPNKLLGDKLRRTACSVRYRFNCLK